MSLMFCTVAHTKDGYGDIKLNEPTFQHFIDYIMGDKRNKKYTIGMDKGKPIIFAVSPSGKYSASFYCPANYFKKYGGCGPTAPNIGPIQRDCQKYAQKNGSTERCYIFAKGYKIVWNSINHKLPKNATPEVIEQTLKELGFYGQQASKKIEKKVEKKETKDTSSSSNLTGELKELHELYKEGVLTKEEFEKAKKKLLN